MAAASDNTKEPWARTFIRFMNAVRLENTEQAVQLLRPHSAVDRRSIVIRTMILIPSSEKTVRSVIQSMYLNNKSASNEEIKEAVEFVSYIELRGLVYNMMIESSPLLLAIKQGNVDEVRLLLQQLPRREAINLILMGPDDVSILLLEPNVTERTEKLYNEILRKYSLTDDLQRLVLTKMLSVTLDTVISAMRKYNRWVSGLVLAMSRGSLDIFMLLSQYEILDEPYIFSVKNIWHILGYIIASHSTHWGVDLTEALLERRPEWTVCINWLIKCVGGGVCGLEVISLILESCQWWDNYVKNGIIGLLINSWDFQTDKGVL